MAMALGLVFAGSSAYGQVPAYKRGAKKIKKALVRLEFDHDDVSAELDRLRDGLFAMDERIDGATRALRSVDTSGFGPSFDLAAASFRLNLAREEKAGAEARIIELVARSDELVAQREEKIAELEEIVEQRIRSRRGASALTVNGSLVTYSADWEAVAMCESSGAWHVDSQFDGGLQFHPVTWLGFGGPSSVATRTRHPRPNRSPSPSVCWRSRAQRRGPTASRPSRSTSELEAAR